MPTLFSVTIARPGHVTVAAGPYRSSEFAALVAPRMHRPERHFGGSLGVTIWTYSRIIGRRLVEFDITHDGATGETTVRVYPGGGLVSPSHDFSVRGLSKREIGRLVYQLDMRFSEGPR
ncbi:hypothetical protein ABZ684_04805 [Streptomyces sp. NPDC006995]|uniref:hypothetical protein n=1 Tax=Streptomyces sp. NPDC006995 TaxID=3156907 RepID=UPI0033CDE94D